jgi:diguanylate cyclase (GGDEF)-like protein
MNVHHKKEQSPLQMQATSTEVARIALCGQWSLDVATGQLLVDEVAADYLQLVSEQVTNVQDAVLHVMPDDVSELIAAFAASMSGRLLDHPFRVVFPSDGVRWFHAQSIPALCTSKFVVGVVRDITEIKRGELREQILAAATQYLIGFTSLGRAVQSVMQLVGRNLGWEWGAYWSYGKDSHGRESLACAYEWHTEHPRLEMFTTDSKSLRMAPGEGLVGKTWLSGEAAWIQDVVDDSSFLRRQAARRCGLHAGFAFPVSFVSESGERYSPGVLEFYSSAAGKRDSELPRLSASIGAFIAQSAYQHRQTAHLRHILQVDQLTGVTSRNHFLNILDALASTATQAGHRFLLLHVHLHRLGVVSEAFGDDSGADYLGEFGRRLQAVLPPECTVGRLMGGDFAVIAPQEVMHDHSAQSLEEAILQAGALPFQIGTRKMATTASVGVAVFPDHANDARGLLGAARTALRNSRASGTRAGNMTVAEELMLETELRAAIRNNELYLEYQPIFHDDNANIAAVEALVRWRRPNGSVVRPDVFIPLAERCGLITTLDSWVAKQAINDLALLRSSVLPHLQMNINMAADDFMDSALPEYLISLAAIHDVPTSQICLELTEGTVMTGPDHVLSVLMRLRECGFKISIDDFGTGHSSLSRLMNLPITSIKIDRSFLQGLPKEGKSGPIVRAMLDLGRYTRLRVVAEGVETEGQQLYLAQFGCRYFQGFHFSKPLSLTDMVKLAEECATSQLTQ